MSELNVVLAAKKYREARKDFIKSCVDFNKNRTNENLNDMLKKEKISKELYVQFETAVDSWSPPHE